MAPPSQRRWFQWHWLTLAMVAWLIWGISDCQFQKQSTYLYGHYRNGNSDFSCGWPFRHLMVRRPAMIRPAFRRAAIVSRPQTREWSGRALTVNCLVWLTLVGSTAWVTERWVRGRKLWQFGSQSLLAFTGVAAVLVAILSQETPGWVFKAGIEPTFEVEWCNIRKPQRLIVPIGIGCAAYFAGWLLCSTSVGCWSWAFCGARVKPKRLGIKSPR